MVSILFLETYLVIGDNCVGFLFNDWPLYLKQRRFHTMYVADEEVVIVIDQIFIH